MKQACKNYVAWKQKNRPFYRPWIFPEQSTLPRLQMLHIKDFSSQETREIVDESNLSEADFVEEELWENGADKKKKKQKCPIVSWQLIIMKWKQKKKKKWKHTEVQREITLIFLYSFLWTP